MADFLERVVKWAVPHANYIPTDTPGRLFIGSAVATRPDRVSLYNFKAVFSLYPPEYSLPEDISHYVCYIDDEPAMTPRMRRLGRELVPLIHYHLSRGDNVLVHCRRGMQRAPTVGVYYLMYLESLTEQRAISKMVAARWVAFRRGTRFTFF